MSVFQFPKWTHPDFRYPLEKPKGPVLPEDQRIDSWIFRNDLQEVLNRNNFVNTGATLSRKGVDFGAGGNYIQSESNGPSGTGDISVFWEMTTTQSGIANHHMINIGAATNDNMFLVIRYDNSLKFGAWGTNGFTSTVLNDGKPHSCLMVYDGTDIKVYIDGSLDATLVYSSLNISALPIHLGSYRGLPSSTSFSYDGEINHFHIIPRAVGAAEAKRLTEQPFRELFKPRVDLAYFAEVGAPPVGTIAPQSHHHRFHNMAG